MIRSDVNWHVITTVTKKVKTKSEIVKTDI